MTTNYGACIDCGRDLPTQDDAHAHMKETGPRSGASGSSHSVRVLNPTPEQKARHRVAYAIERAVDEFCEDIDREVERGDITADQVTAALTGYPDFSDAWAEYVEGSA